MRQPSGFFIPETWDEAIALREEHSSKSAVIAGGTDLMLHLSTGSISPQYLISLSQLPSWGSHKINGAVLLSAGTSFRQIEREKNLLQRHKALISAASQVGGVQIRNVATIGGNLCNASPAADSVPPLLVLDAELVIYGSKGERTIPVESFFLGPGQTSLKEAELLHSVIIPELPDRTVSEFVKHGRRSAMEISIASVAARLTLAEDGKTCESARIALGAVAPTPLRIQEAEKVLENNILTEEALEISAQIVQKTVSPISDVRASAEYRREVCGVLVKRVLNRCHIVLTGSPVG